MAICRQTWWHDEQASMQDCMSGVFAELADAADSIFGSFRNIGTCGLRTTTISLTCIHVCTLAHTGNKVKVKDRHGCTGWDWYFLNYHIIYSKLLNKNSGYSHIYPLNPATSK